MRRTRQPASQPATEETVQSCNLCLNWGWQFVNEERTRHGSLQPRRVSTIAPLSNRVDRRFSFPPPFFSSLHISARLIYPRAHK